MTDTLEHDVKAMLDRKGGEAGLAPVAPAPVLRRVRRRQARNVIVGAVASVAVVLGAVIGTQALLGADDHDTVPADRTTTTTVRGVTITYPKSWHRFDLTSIGGQRAEEPLALFALANFRVSGRTMACASRDPAVPPDAAMLVLMDSGSAGVPAGRPGWPVRVERVNTPGDPCSRGLTSYQAVWVAEGHAFEGTIALGPKVSDKARRAAFRAFRSMRFSPIDRPTDTTVIGTGVVDGTRWTVRVNAGRGGGSPSLEFETERNGVGTSSGSASAGPPPTIDLNARRIGRGPRAIVVLYGLVKPHVARVSILGTSSTVEPAPLPAGYHSGLKSFVLQVPSGTTGPVVALDASGNELASRPIRVTDHRSAVQAPGPAGGASAAPTG